MRERLNKAAALQWAGVMALYAVTAAMVWKILQIQVDNLYAGDFLAHIQTALNPDETGYSALNQVYQLIWAFTGSYDSMVLFVLLMCLGGIAASGWFLHRYAGTGIFASGLLGWCCFCADPIYLPFLNDYRVLGVQAFGVWHNPTLIGIKLLGVFVLALYLRMVRQFDEGVRWCDWLAFLVLLALATGVKPSLLFCFAPAMAVLMLWDFVRGRCQRFGRYVWFGCAVLPALAVVFAQYLVLFAGGPQQHEESGLAFSLGANLLQRTQHPIASIFQSVVFVLVVAGLCVGQLLKDRMLCMTWGMTGFAYLQHIFLVETGPRASDGNWTWGTSVSLFLLFLASTVRLWQQTGRWKEQTPLRKGLICLCWLLFAWQSLCGLQYMILFIKNGTFYL